MRLGRRKGGGPKARKNDKDLKLKGVENEVVECIRMKDVGVSR